MLTVTDVNGNSASAEATVTVEDNIAPSVFVNNITVELNASGVATITPAQINNNSTDNCSIQGYALDITSFDCGDVGENTVVLTVTDVNGNSASAEATVTVEDGVAPKVAIKNITIQLGSTGTASILPAQVNNGSSDACGIASMSVSPNTFNCSNLGPNPVILSVTDVNGNSASATAMVTVENPVTLEYNGTTIQATAANSTIANVQLVAIIDNIENQSGCSISATWYLPNLDTPDPTDRIFIGSINGSNITQITDTKFRVTATGSFNIGTSPYLIYDVEVVAGCYYTGTSATALLTVYKPNGDMVTGGGYIIPDDSEGTFASTANKKANFGFNVKSKPTGIQGDVNYKFERQNKEYQIKSTSFNSLGVVIDQSTGIKYAQFSANATLTCPSAGVNEAGVLYVTLTDNGEPGNNDYIGFTLWNGTTLLYSSKWSDYYTEEMLIGGGNLVVHKGLMQTEEVEEVIIPVTFEESPLTVYPNPTNDKATFKFVPGADSRAKIEIYNVNGVLVETLYDGNVVEGNLYEIEYKPALRNSAMLLYRLILDEKVFTGKLMIQK